ncbi:MAG TPA: DUF3617 domain-containing protein [Allosphingosinicella sp.]|nr:DUF3617 domain-containing protein [Allosphingosinicella sp.]
MRLLIGVAALVALSACGGGNEGDGNKAADGKAGGGGGSAATMQPGEWEMTTTVTRMNVPGMPAGANAPMPGPQTARTCLTAADVAENANFVNETAGAGCTSQGGSMSGGRIQANVQCTRPEGQMRMTMNGQYTATTLEMTQQVQTSMPGGQNVEMEARIAGRRVGDCPAGAAEQTNQTK